MSEEKTTQVEESPNVTQVDVDLDEIFGMPGAESVTVPTEEADKTANVLSNNKTDMSFLDEEDSPVEEPKAEEESKEDEVNNEEESKNFFIVLLNKSSIILFVFNFFRKEKKCL